MSGIWEDLGDSKPDPLQFAYIEGNMHIILMGKMDSTPLHNNHGLLWSLPR